jgi:KUP system potassium uptake protein
MWTWKQGREILLQHIHEGDPKLQDFVLSLGFKNNDNSKKPRIERTAVFLCANQDTVPQALMHNLKHNQVLHQTNLILTVKFADIPVVAKSQRVTTKEIGAGFWQVQVNYGFMESPDIPKALAECGIQEFGVDPFTTSYFISRETIISGPTAKNQASKMAKWRDDLFALMSRNAGSVVTYFNIPSNSVIELGTRVHI